MLGFAVRRCLGSASTGGIAHTPATAAAASLLRSPAARFASSSATTAADERLIDPTYPEVNDVSAQVKKPWGFWNKQDRRNFGEVLDEDDDVKTVWVVDEESANGRVKPGQAVKQLLLMFGILAGFYSLLKLVKIEEKQPVTPRELPYQPEVLKDSK